jgi:hypothetical protein
MQPVVRGQRRQSFVKDISGENPRKPTPIVRAREKNGLILLEISKETVVNPGVNPFGHRENPVGRNEKDIQRNKSYYPKMRVRKE